ncbi:helix-turn-helix transcriptional regulator [Methylocystis echinoides]|nr:LuxR family transcriptional regulator [Methylocystis echinoides]
MSKMELVGLIESVEEAAGEPLQIIDAARRFLDLRHLSYVALTFPKPSGSKLPIFTSTYPIQWQNHYVERDYVRIDPVVVEAAKSNLPVDWTKLDTLSEPGRTLFGEAREFGIPTTGLTIPFRGQQGELAVLSACADFSARTWEDYKHENIWKLMVANSLIHRRILDIHNIADRRPKLTRREIECLCWTSQGKTCADVATILNIAETTARCYLNSARSKLNCVTIAHCVAKAISMRLIPPVS